MHRRDLLKSALPSALAVMLPRMTSAEVPQEPVLVSDRAFWLEQMQRVAHPVLEALRAGGTRRILRRSDGYRAGLRRGSNMGRPRERRVRCVRVTLR
jgi:hypothetical protein